MVSEIHAPSSIMQGSSTYTVIGLLLLGTSALSCRCKKHFKRLFDYKGQQVTCASLQRQGFLIPFLFPAALLPCWVMWLWQDAPNTALSLGISILGLQKGRGHDLIRSWYIHHILPVCTSACRGFILLAQSHAPIRSPGSDSVLGD